MHRRADSIDPSVITAAESAAGSVPGVLHAHARARWTGRTLRVEIEGRVDPGLPALEADALGQQVAAALTRQLPEAGSLTWISRAGPAGNPVLSATVGAMPLTGGWRFRRTAGLVQLVPAVNVW